MKLGSTIATAALLGATPLATVALPVAVQAQTSGESRCGADGYVERYSGYLRAWQQSATRCNNSGGGEGSRYNRGGNGGGGDDSQDGISRCGADGYVERYSSFLHRWQQSAMHCK